MLSEDRKLLWALVLVGCASLSAFIYVEVKNALPSSPPCGAIGESIHQTQQGQETQVAGTPNLTVEPNREDTQAEELREGRINECLLTNYTGSLATYTAILAGATILLGIFGFAQGCILYAQFKLGRQEFIATHRPRLRVRLVKIDKLETGKPIVVRYRVVNVGDGEAISIAAETTLQVVPRDGIPKETISRTQTFEIAASIKSGQPIEVERAFAEIVLPEWHVKGSWGFNRIRVYGSISYQDGNRVPRQTGFYRFCTEDVNRFRLPGDKDIERDYEYED